ncbi:MAG: Glycosyl transferase family protein 3 [Microgenomates group bacterium GW2011_GWC1_39_12]|nr:MAG: Glycosyl transferase family protein 3 [Microgenomates group bacterium GW2011_GWC1_39_12]
MKTTLIICCKNEDQSLASVIKKAKPFVHEIIVVDGHSQDSSLSIAKNSGAKVFTDNGKGKGAGIQLGIQKASGDIIVFMDADGSHKASDIPKLIAPIKHNDADLVIASRGKGGSDELHGESEKTLRLIGSAIITQIINWRYGTRITDSQNGFRAIRTSVVKSLNLQENSFAIEQEMLMKALHKHYRVSEIASHELARKYGRSKISLYSMWWKYLWNLMQNCVTF